MASNGGAGAGGIQRRHDGNGGWRAWWERWLTDRAADAFREPWILCVRRHTYRAVVHMMDAALGTGDKRWAAGVGRTVGLVDAGIGGQSGAAGMGRGGCRDV